MAATKPRCLHSASDAPAAGQGCDHEELRARAAGMLRCASQLACAQAVPCSDDAMALLRRVLPAPDRTE